MPSLSSRPSTSISTSTSTSTSSSVSSPSPSSSSVARPPLLLGVDLSGAGARPAVHRARGAVQPRSFDAERFVRLVRTADDGGLDLVTLDEAFLLHPGRRQVAGRLDAAVAAARVAPRTRRVGLVVAVDTVHVDPAHIAQAIGRVDRKSAGRVAWQVGLPAGVDVQDDAWAARSRAVAAQVAGQWDAPAPAGGVAVDGDGRYRVDHEGIRFAVRRHEVGRPGAGGHDAEARDAEVRGPAETWLGRPPVVVAVRSAAALGLVARTADVVRVPAVTPDQAVRARSRLRHAAEAAGRDPDAVRVLVEASVVLAADRASARTRRELVEALEGPEAFDGRLVVAGTPDDLARTVVEWRDAGATDGFVLRPSSVEADLAAVVGGLLPQLVRDGVRGAAVPAPRTLRATLGLPDVGRGSAVADVARLVRA